jgi:putative ABC transport system ATP-binding protein
VPDKHLVAEQVTVSYGPPQARMNAVAGVTLDFEPGTLTLIMGPSGSGKTTLLSVLGCLLRPDQGRVFVNGADANRLADRERTEMRRRHIGFIFQAFRLFHSLSAFQNVMLAAEVAGPRDGGHREHALELLSQLGLGEKLRLKPDALSGGEKQRVAIARALVSNPQIVLADEPTASVDSASGRQISEILRNLATERRQIVVVVSHDERWTEFAHRTVVLRDGRVADDRSHVC